MRGIKDSSWEQVAVLPELQTNGRHVHGYVYAIDTLGRMFRSNTTIGGGWKRVEDPPDVEVAE